MPPNSSDAIDYGSLLDRLTAHACQFLNASRTAAKSKVVQGTALSPEDFAINVVEKLALGEIPHDNSQGIGGLIRYLTVAIEHDILDALDRAEHKRVDFLDPIVVAQDDQEGQEKALADLGATPDDPADWLDGELFKSRVYSLVEDDPELKEMAIAIFEVNALKPREIAAVCMTTTTEIQNRKKRFALLLQKMEYKPKKRGAA